MMSVVQAMHMRRSVRAFRPDPVDPAVLRGALEAAQRAPSGGNLQPWRAIVVTGEPWENLKAKVADRLAMGPAGTQMEYAIYPEVLPEPWKGRRFGVGEALYAALDIPRDNKMGRMMQFARNYQGFGAPVMLFLYTPRTMGPPQWSDMGMWLQSLMLLLSEAGLGTCAQECWAAYGQTVRGALDIADDQILFCGLAIGHADDADPVNRWPVPRAPLDEVVEWRGFGE
jgi:nitroreductase